MKYIIDLLFIGGLVFLSGCGSSDFSAYDVEVDPRETLIVENLSNFESMSTRTEANVTRPLLGFNSLGEITTLSNLSILRYETLSNGIYVVVTETFRNDSDTEVVINTKYFVEKSGISHEITSTGSFFGETKGGLIIFSNADSYNIRTQTLSPLSTNLNKPTVRQLSGNFIVIVNETNTIYQLFDTETLTRYNIRNSNIVALNDTHVFMTGGVLNILTGSLDGSINPGDWDNESMSEVDGMGALLLSQEQNGTACLESTKSCVYSIAENGVSTLLGERGFDVASTTPNSIVNSSLFSDNNYIVIKEISQLSVMRRSDLSIKTILDDLNVAAISYDEGIVYFTGEDKLGNRKNGKYNLTLDTITYYSDDGIGLNKVKVIN